MFESMLISIAVIFVFIFGEQMYSNKIRRPFCLATGNSDVDLKLAIDTYKKYLNKDDLEDLAKTYDRVYKYLMHRDSYKEKEYDDDDDCGCHSKKQKKNKFTKYKPSKSEYEKFKEYNNYVVGKLYHQAENKEMYKSALDKLLKPKFSDKEYMDAIKELDLKDENLKKALTLYNYPLYILNGNDINTPLSLPKYINNNVVDSPGGNRNIDKYHTAFYLSEGVYKTEFVNDKYANLLNFEGNLTLDGQPYDLYNFANGIDDSIDDFNNMVSSVQLNLRDYFNRDNLIETVSTTCAVTNPTIRHYSSSRLDKVFTIRFLNKTSFEVGMPSGTTINIGSNFATTDSYIEGWKRVSSKGNKEFYVVFRGTENSVGSSSTSRFVDWFTNLNITPNIKRFDNVTSHTHLGFSISSRSFNWKTNDIVGQGDFVGYQVRYRDQNGFDDFADIDTEGIYYQHNITSLNEHNTDNPSSQHLFNLRRFLRKLQNNGYDVIFCGHSLGGAIATDLALSCLHVETENNGSATTLYDSDIHRLTPDQTALITIGAPRSIGSRFRTLLRQLMMDNPDFINARFVTKNSDWRYSCFGLVRLPKPKVNKDQVVQLLPATLSLTDDDYDYHSDGLILHDLVTSRVAIEVESRGEEERTLLDTLRSLLQVFDNVKIHGTSYYHAYLHRCYDYILRPDDPSYYLESNIRNCFYRNTNTGEQKAGYHVGRFDVCDNP